MSIKFSKYVRQGKKTFRFISTSGGVYGSNVAYEYGYFNGNRLDGISHFYHSETEIESDPDERDGIGSMRTIRKRSTWLGSFKDGKMDGFCIPLTQTSKELENKIFFVEGKGFTIEETEELIKQNGDFERLSDSGTAYIWGKNAIIYEGDELVYIGQLYDEENPFFCTGLDEETQQITGGFFRGEEHIPFTFNDWQEMPVDPVEETGFSVLREMDYFSDSNVRYTITEGFFDNGKLNGLGMKCYDSDCNGYHNEYQKIGIFKDGKLFFGYSKSYESGGKPRKFFGYADKREIEKYGEEIVYDGKKYIGEAVNGIPNGIGCLFESQEKMLKGTFKNGKLHGVGVTYKYLNDKWIEYDFEQDKNDTDFYRKSFNMYANGEIKNDMTWEEFYDTYENVKKV